MKKIINEKTLILVSLLLLLPLLVGCFSAPPPTNQAPTITSTSITTATVAEAYAYNVNATDPDGDTLTYSLTTKPTGMTINSANGVISWTPTSTQLGNHSVTVAVSDGSLSSTQSFIIIVSEAAIIPSPTHPTVVVVPVSAISVSAITVTGNAVVGATLTAAPTPGAATGTYQWKSSDTSGGTYANITGATSSTYVIDGAYAGKFIKVTFTATGSYTGTITSAATTAVTEAVVPVSAITDADVAISSGSVIFGYTFTSASGAVTYGEAKAAPYYLNVDTSTVTLTDADGSNSSVAYVTDLGIADNGTVEYADLAAVQSKFADLNFVPTEVLIHLVGASSVNSGSDAWTKDVTVPLDAEETALLIPVVSAITAGVTKLGTAPTDANATESQANQDAVTVAQTGNAVTVTGNLEELNSYASTNSAQGTAKWVGLVVATGESDITNVYYNGAKLAQADVDDANSVNAPAGSFVLWIKAEDVAATAKTFTLKTDSTQLTTITVNFTDTSAQ